MSDLMDIPRWERLPPPEDINERMGAIFGLNYFAEPMFRFVWGQTETRNIRGASGNYISMLVGHNKPAWLLQRWCAPEMYWTPELYYKLTADRTGRAVLGEYPEFGFYETLVTFIEQHVENGVLKIETIELTWDLVEKLLPVLMASQKLSEAEKISINEATEAAENAEKVSRIADRMYDALPSFYGPTSFAGKEMRTSLLDRKMDAIRAEWARRKIFEKRPPGQFGLSQQPI
jgi:hypothetical protein